MNAKSTTLLTAIATAMLVPPNYLFATPATAKELVELGFAEGNPGITNPENAKEQAFRLTEIGKAEADKLRGTSTPTFVIAKVERPKVNRSTSATGSKYPFAQLQPGQAFFIPAPADMKSPSKSFGSMVSAANKKYSGADFRRFTVRSMVGDEFGQPGVKGIGVFRMEEAEEAAAKAHIAKVKAENKAKAEAAAQAAAAAAAAA